MGRRFIRQAEEELERGDLLQASEKAWGAVVHYLKGIARRRGWDHGNHYQLSQTANRLADETGDSDLLRFFSAAQSLHANFYNNWKTEDIVRINLEDVKRLVDILGGLYDNGSGDEGAEAGEGLR